jgi:hypothetical protein
LGLKAKGKRKVDRGVQEEGEGRRRRAEIVDSRERRRQKREKEMYSQRGVASGDRSMVGRETQR